MRRQSAAIPVTIGSPLILGSSAGELDALSPNILRSRVREEILNLLNIDAWDQMEMVEAAERESIEKIDW
jgi:hypothetical protein